MSLSNPKSIFIQSYILRKHSVSEWTSFCEMKLFHLNELDMEVVRKLMTL